MNYFSPHLIRSTPPRIALAILALLFSFASAPGLKAQDEISSQADAVEIFNKGQDLHEKGEFKAAIEQYEKALKLIPEFAEAELQRGNALLALGQLADAEAAFRKAIAIREDWSLAHSYLGTALVRQNKFDEAKPVLRKAIDLDQENTPAWVASAEVAIRTKAPESELRTIYKKIASLSAGARPSISILSSKAELERALKEDKAAAASAQRVLELDEKNLPMLYLSADAAIKANDAAKAGSLIARIEMIDKASTELPMLKVRWMIAAGKPEDAEKFIASIKEPSKELVEIKRQLTPSTEADIPALEKDLATDPRNIVALSRLCSLYRKVDPAQALDRCKRAADVEPNNIDHAIGYAAALLQAKQYPQATLLLRKLTGVAPENYTVRANLASALFQQKLYTEAKEQFKWLIEKQPSNAVAHFFVAIAHDELGEYADAMANYQLFIKLADPKINQLEIEKVNLRLPTLQRQLDAGKGKSNAKTKSKT